MLPNSVMMGMLDPVVTDACRTKPCTGLLSGDDLSIPGGVKPTRHKKQAHGSQVPLVNDITRHRRVSIENVLGILL